MAITRTSLIKLFIQIAYMNQKVADQKENSNFSTIGDNWVKEFNNFLATAISVLSLFYEFFKCLELCCRRSFLLFLIDDNLTHYLQVGCVIIRCKVCLIFILFLNHFLKYRLQTLAFFLYNVHYLAIVFLESFVFNFDSIM